ncbi:hypothetical protein A6A04_13735 [Paramagnetospirillum marisnigri]|uniref:histidine kinase n=1 Tax=Paramagnetospirillum marisnigri TaxID=1285242 RepID=A0A178MX22_9PROT|nr:sensor histidine kinase [Paramagnetospirillum marisnigri]OAN53946.1 hypothetical protein A6A04_13735 [Paramagnetospirillum marisnigri]
MTAICLVITGASVGPLAITLRDAAYGSLGHMVELKAMAAEEFLSRGRGLAQQITSRTVIRDKLAEYHDGRIDLASVSDFTRDKLLDALNLSAELMGIVRLGAKGELVVAIGQKFDWSHAALPGPDSSRPIITPPMVIDNLPYVVVAAPIISRGGQRLGTDLALIDARRLVGILRDESGLGTTGDMAIVLTQSPPQLLIPFGRDRIQAGARLAQDDPVSRIAAAANGQQTRFDATRDPILVATPIPGTEWALVMRMDKGEATASVDTLVLVVTLSAIGLAMAGVIGLLLVLRPLTGGIIVQTQDMRRQIDDLEQAKAELQEKSKQLALSNADLQEFAYVASHDLQEPLRMIASYAQLLERRYKGKLDSEAVEFIGFMVDGVNRMQAIILHLLEYSRVGGKGHAVVEFDSSEAVSQALANLAIAIKESGAVITADSLPVIHADRLQFTRLIQNLVGNAIKYRHPDRPPRITLAAERQQSQWCFSVADNGIGIEQQYYDRIFKLFQRLHPRGKYEGTGIGLAICRKIVDIHGGTMWVESVPGEGSTFYFTLRDEPDAAEQAS